jgi:hypothetical protein
MGYRAWTIEHDGKRHTIEVDHGYWSGRRLIKVDAETIHTSRKWWDTGSEHRFDVEEHACILKIRNSPFHYDYELFVDGKMV